MALVGFGAVTHAAGVKSSWPTKASTIANNPDHTRLLRQIDRASDPSVGEAS